MACGTVVVEQVFVFFSVVASVGNSSIRATIFLQHSDCLNGKKKWVYNFKSGYASQTVLFMLQIWWFFQCHHCLENKRDQGGYLPLIHISPAVGLTDGFGQSDQLLVAILHQLLAASLRLLADAAHLAALASSLHCHFNLQTSVICLYCTCST